MSDSSCGGCTSTSLPIGVPGATGATGSQGEFGGFSGSWLFSTSTATGPTATFLRLNNATPSAVTAIYVSDTNSDSIDYDAFLDSFSNNSKYGYIRIFKETDNTKFCTYEVTAVTDNGTDHTLAVTYISSNSTFVASDSLVLTFSPAGKGGSEVLNNNTTPSTTGAAIKTVLMSYTIPANQMKTNGDVVEILAVLDTNGETEDKSTDVMLGGTVCHAKRVDFRLYKGEKYISIKLIVTRQSATTVFIDIDTTSSGSTYQKSNGVALFETGFSVLDLSTTGLLIEIRANNIAPIPTETITQNHLLVKYLNKA